MAFSPVTSFTCLLEAHELSPGQMGFFFRNGTALNHLSNYLEKYVIITGGNDGQSYKIKL